MAEGPKAERKSPVVVVVADDSEVRDILRVELQVEEFTVVTAANGAEAVATATSLRPDVILMDLVMPVMDGIEATQKLAGNQVTRHIPVVMVTVVENKDEIARALQAGAFDWVSKPFFLPELKARVHAALRHKRLYDELTIARKQVAENEKIKAVKEVFSTIQESITSKLTVIMGKVDIIRSKQGNASKDDLNSILNAALKINKSINYFDVLDAYPLAAVQNCMKSFEFDRRSCRGPQLR
jgi:two-component system sensor histidine kinase/response regulator